MLHLPAVNVVKNVVVPLVTIKGQTKVALSGAYWYWEGTTRSLCFSEPLTDSSVHIIKILHMITLVSSLSVRNLTYPLSHPSDKPLHSN